MESRTQTHIVVWLVWGAFSLFGLLMIVGGGQEILHAFESRNWPASEGVITASSIKTDTIRSETTGSDGRRQSRSDPVYSPAISYRYTVNGDEYTGDRVTVASVATADRSGPEAVVQRYPVGKTVTVYHAPDDPGWSMLEPGFQPSSFYILFGGLALCGFGWWLGRFTKRMMA